MSADEEKPRYYEFLASLLESGPPLNKVTKERILNQYRESPDLFEVDVNVMSRQLMYMGMRPEQANVMALKFHSQIHGVPESQLAAMAGIPMVGNLSYGQPVPYQSGVPLQNQNLGYGGYSQGGGMAELIEGFKQVIREANMFKAFSRILGEDGEKNNTSRETNPQDLFMQLLPFMAMFNPNIGIQTSMTEDGKPKIQSFTVTPAQGAMTPIGDLMKNIIEKSSALENMLVQTLLNSKDEKIEDLKRQINSLANSGGPEATLQNLKNMLEVQKMLMREIGLGKASGNPELDLKLEELRMKYQLDSQKFQQELENQRLRNQIALQEYLDKKEEKLAQMKLAEKAVDAVTTNVGQIVQEVASPVLREFGQGVVDGIRENRSNQINQRMRSENAQKVNQKSSSQSKSFDMTTPSKSLESLSDQELGEAIKKASEVYMESVKMQKIMKDYLEQFKNELERRKGYTGMETEREVPQENISESPSIEHERGTQIESETTGVPSLIEALKKKREQEEEILEQDVEQKIDEIEQFSEPVTPSDIPVYGLGISVPSPISIEKKDGYLVTD